MHFVINAAGINHPDFLIMLVQLLLQQQLSGTNECENQLFALQ